MRAAMRANGRPGVRWVNIFETAGFKFRDYFFHDRIFHGRESNKNILQIRIVILFKSRIDVV